MSQYNSLRATIDANIKTNGNEEITGSVLNSVLNAMVTTLGAGYQYMGKATPSDPGSAQTPDYKCFYLATDPGTYTYLGGLVVNAGEVAILKYDSSWHKDSVCDLLMVAPDSMNGGFDLSLAGQIVAMIASQDNMMSAFNALVDSDFSTLVPDSVISGEVATDTGLVGSASYDIWVYQITPGKNYRFTGALLAGIDRRLIYYSSDSAGETIVGWDEYKGDTSTTERQDFEGNLHFPAGAQYILLNVRTYSESFVSRFSVMDIDRTPLIKVRDQIGKLTRSIKEVARGGEIDYNHLVSYISSPLSVTYQANSAWDALWIRLTGQKKVTMNGAVATAYNFFSSATEISTDTFLSRNKTGLVPEGAVVCICSMSHASNPDGYDNMTITFDYRKRLRVLSIGNSYSQDSLAYVPFIMENMGYSVEIGILMMSSSTLAQHVDNFDNETAAYTFYRYDGHDAWLNAGSRTIQYALENYKWDVILLQQQSKASWDIATYQPYLNQLIARIYGVIDYPVKFGWLETQSRPATGSGLGNYTDATINSHFESIAENAGKVFDETLCEFVVPVGTAIQNARSVPAIKALGGYATNTNNTSGLGYLCHTDGVHLQEGLPCQIAAYACICSFLDLMGAKINSIYGETTRATDSWLSGKEIPGPHGASVGVTDENCQLGQMAAIMAYKHPYSMTDMNDIVDPDNI